MNPSQVRRPLTAVAAALALASACAVPARADDPPPPDLSSSTVSCRPENAAGPGAPGTTRPGDDVVCVLTVRVTGPQIAFTVTGDMSIPPGTVYDPLPNAQGAPFPAGQPTRVDFGPSLLGFTTPGQPKTASVRFRIGEDAEPDATIQAVAHVRDPAAGELTMVSNVLTVMPQPADLQPSSTRCANADPAATLIHAGDTVECAFRLAAKAKREDAVGVMVSAPIPKDGAWAAGGNESFQLGGYFTWLTASVLPDGAGAPGTVPSGGTAGPLRFRFTVDPNAAGGTTIFVNGQVSWTNALSRTLGSLGLGAAPLTIAPGPARLTGSALGCVDLSGAPLVPGDALFCTASVAAAAGHEDAMDVGGFADIPALTVAGSAVLDPSGPRIPFDGGQLGAIKAGTARSVSYTLKVTDGARPGNVVVPTAQVAGTSTPSGVPITQRLTAATFVVGVKPGPAAAAGAVVSPAAAAATAAKSAAATKDPKICGSRRVVTVNVKPPKRARWKSVTFSYAKKTVKGKKAGGKTGAFRARLVFQGLPKGALKVSITGVTTKGKKIRAARTYTLCAKKK
jgi:hypothetical protein